MTTLRKIFNTLTLQQSPPSPTTATNNGPNPPRQRGASDSTTIARRKGAPPDLAMEDLLSWHLAQRSERMFQAELTETAHTIETRRADSAPNVGPASTLDFEPPPPTARPRHRSSRPRREAAEPSRSASRNANPVPHMHPFANRPLLSDPLEDLARTDRSIRVQALADISAVMTHGELSAKNAALALKKVRDRCRKAGVPFGQLLSEELTGFEGTNMNPLVLEIIRCEFSTAPELLLFLLEHSQSKTLQHDVRRGCVLRQDTTNLYEILRHLIPCSATNPWDPPPFEYEISVQQEERSHYTSHAVSSVNLLGASSSASGSRPSTRAEFQALISIPNFPQALALDASALAKRRSIPPEKRGGPGPEELLRAEAGLLVEFIACNRAWTLEIGSNKLTMTLVDGESCNVDAKLTVVKEERPSVLPKLDIAPIPGFGERPVHSPSGPRQPPLRLDTANLQPVLVSVEPPTPQNPAPSAPVFTAEPQSTLRSKPLPAPVRPPRAARPLLFPNITVHPLRSRGPHKVILSPCFPPYAPVVTSFNKAVLSSKELLVELVVKLGPPRPDGMDERRASVGGRSFFRGDGTDSPADGVSCVEGSPRSQVFEDDDAQPLDPFEDTPGAGPSQPYRYDTPRSASYGL